VKYGVTNSINQLFQGFSTSYNSLQVKFDRRFSSGLTVTTAFTWQKAMAFQTGDHGGPYLIPGPYKIFAPAFPNVPFAGAAKAARLKQRLNGMLS
jgi:hypothetical protein